MSERSLGNRTEGAPSLPVSIVTVAFDTYFFTRLLVEKVRELTTDRPFEIIVVDRGSADESLPWLQAQPDVRIVSMPQSGPSHRHGEAASEGIRQTRHPIVVLLDSDAHPVAADWLGTTASRLNKRVRLAGALVHSGHVGNPYGYY
ncbi:MAG: glycosyltransferase, partial [Terrimicrobiaceae bacterium]